MFAKSILELIFNAKYKWDPSSKTCLDIWCRIPPKSSILKLGMSSYGTTKWNSKCWSVSLLYIYIYTRFAYDAIRRHLNVIEPRCQESGSRENNTTQKVDLLLRKLIRVDLRRFLSC